MATCRFCQREFANAQAVRAHLKSCEPYQDRRATRQDQADGSRETHLRQPGLRDGSLGGTSLRRDALTLRNPVVSLTEERPNAAADRFDPVRQLDQEIALEQRRIKLRELHDAQDDLDRRTKTRDQERQRDADREAETKRTAEREQQARRQRELDAQRLEEECARQKEQRARRRREVIQDAKREVIDRWPYAGFVSSHLHARMLIEIDKTLSALPADELPLDELVRIAEGVRDRLYEEAKAAERETLRRTQERDTRKARLRQQGTDTAKRELRDVDGLDFFEAFKIEQRIARTLDDITGDESPEDIDDLVEDILEREGIGFDDDDGEDDE